MLQLARILQENTPTGNDWFIFFKEVNGVFQERKIRPSSILAQIFTDTCKSISGNIGQPVIINTCTDGLEVLVNSVKALVLLSNGNVGIGTASPQFQLHLVRDTNSSLILMGDTYTNVVGFATGWATRKARGTEASPSAIQNNDVMGTWGSRGYGSTGFQSLASALMRVVASENWTDTEQGAAIEFLTTQNGGTIRTVKLRIEDNGDITAARFRGVSDYQRAPFKQNTTISHTGTTANTIIASFLIPAGTFSANDILRFGGYLTQTNNANVKTARIYVNDTVTLTGATQIALRTLTSSQGLAFARDLVFKNSLSSQEVVNATASFADSETNTNTAVTTLSIDFTVDQHIIVAVELADSSDTVSLRWLRSQILR